MPEILSNRLGVRHNGSQVSTWEDGQVDRDTEAWLAGIDVENLDTVCSWLSL